MFRLLKTISWDEVHSWPELEAAMRSLYSEQARGEVFEEFCYAYFLLQSDLYQIKDIWRFRDVPQAVLSRLGTNTTQDKGIDGVLSHHDGTLTVYQSKFRIDPTNVVSQRELSTFYMVSDRADYRLVVSNVNDLPVVVKERKDHGQILLDKLRELGPEFFDRLKDLVESGGPRRAVPLTPRPYQDEALFQILAGFRDSDRGQAIIACGAGKTLIGKWVFDRLNCKTALIMVPSLALIRQTLGEWHRARSASFQYLCVCSDSTVDARSDDSWSIYPSELDCRVTTDPNDVVRFLLASHNVPHAIFCTYQSGEVIVKALQSNQLQNFFFDLAICDEAHRLAGVSDRSFAHVLLDELIRVRKRLFMTATPRIVEPVRGNAEPEVELPFAISMDDQSFFGAVFFRFGFRRAIEEQIICDYQIIVIGVTEDQAADLLPQSDTVSISDAGKWAIEGLAQRIALGKAISTFLIKKIFSFHNRVETAERFVNEQLSDSLPSIMRKLTPQVRFMCAHVSGAMTAGARARILGEFGAADRGFISNARCLGEGVNLPDVDGIFFADPRESVIEIVQATGRALRRNSGKKTAYVIIPVLVRQDEDPEQLLKSSRFNSVWNVLSAMMSQDERALEATVEALIARGYESEKFSNQISRVLGQPDYHTTLLDFPRSLPLSEYQKLFTLEALERTGDRWYVRFGALKKYMETHGEEPAVKTEFHGIRLGTWLAAQRTAFRKERLSADRIRMLGELGISLPDRPSHSRANFRWEKWLIACKVYQDSKGRLPSANDTNEWGFKIGVWLSNQRRKYREGKLSEDQISRFQEMLGPAWDPRADRWNENLAAYKDYVEKTGQQPKKFTKHNDINIGLWLYRLRGDPSSLSRTQIEALNAIGMRWIRDPSDVAVSLSPGQMRKKFSQQTEDEWLSYYVAYKNWVSSANQEPSFNTGSATCDLGGDRAASHNVSERHLRVWLEVQKRLYEINKLAERRRHLIDNLMRFILETRSV